jgi:hypothetical protein
LSVQERAKNSKYGALTQVGGNYLVMKVDSSQTCGITEFLTSTKEKTQNIKRLFFTRDLVTETRSGKFSISIQLRKFNKRD